MDYNTPDLNSWPAKLVLRISNKIRSSRSYSQQSVRRKGEQANKLRKKRAGEYGHTTTLATSQSMPQPNVNELGEREYSVFSEATTLVEGRKDHTDMLHGLGHSESLEALVDQARMRGAFDVDELDVEVVTPLMELRSRQIAAVPANVWLRIASFLSPSDAASLATATKTLYEKLDPADHLEPLNDPENFHHKTQYLQHRDRRLPEHLFCFPCARYHLRSNPGNEVLKMDYVANPLFICPSVRSAVLPRMRIVHGRQLPYSFIQLATRASRHSPIHGIQPESLSRRWKCKDSTWSHRTRYIIHDGRLLMRVVSSAPAPPAKEMTETSARHLLYDREEYTPYFSVCAHWKDGELMKTAKCALSHIPEPPQSYYQQLKKAPKINRALARPNFIVRGCDDCRPARRCPECPTEYLIEVQMTEDKNDISRPFKHTIVVTRWSDLGDGSSPYTSPEYAAIQGVDTGTGYNSFSHVGRRAVGGIFESRVSGSIPGQRMISLNPKNEKLGESGHGWY